MKMPQKAVDHPVTTVMAFLAILLFGIVAITMLRIDVLPDIEYPALTILTVYPGASAQEVEQQVTKVLEENLSSVTDLKSIKSKSMENVSLVYLIFDWNTNLSEASNDARDRLEFAKRHLPDDSQSPIISKVNSSMLPVLTYGVEARESRNALDKIIEDRISNKLKKLPGVGSVLVLGQPIRQVHIDVDPYKLHAYGLTIPQIVQSIELQNVSIPGGNIKIGKNDLAISVKGELQSVAEIENVTLATLGTHPVHLRDVAAVKDTLKETNEIMRSNQRSAVGIMVQKQSGSNTVEVVRTVREEIEKIQQTLPADVTVSELVDSSELVTESLDNLLTTICWAGVFVVLVVFIFLRQWKSSLIVILTIPFSLIVAFIFMYVFDYTINIFSMMSLAIAIGMVVDNAIVVLENITRHIAKGESPPNAAKQGASEMGMAISASTLTTISVFLPLVFIGGVVGILFKQLAILTAITIIASLATALSLTPMLSSRLLKNNKQRSTQHGKLFRSSEKVFDAVERSYTGLLNQAIRHRGLSMTLAGILFIASLLLATQIGSDYIPKFDAGDVMARIELEVGVTTEETARIATQVENIILEELEPGQLRAMFSVIGQTESGVLSLTGFKEGKNCASIVAKIVNPDERKERISDIANRARNKIALIPEIEKFSISGGSLLETGITANEAPIEVKISGSDFNAINTTAQQIEEQLHTLPYLKNVESTIDRGKLELAVHVNRDKAQSLRLNTGMIGLAIRQSIYGADASTYEERGDEYDIVVRYASQHRKNLQQIKNISIASLTGEQVPLSSIASITEERGPLEIQRESQQRVVYVNADLHEISLGEAVEKVQAKLEDMEFSPEASVDVGGQYEDQQESFGSLSLLFVIGLLLVYMVMASQFESFRHPFIIMFSVPLSIIGVVLAFVITGTTLSVVTFIGIIMLLGIVVNNGIVLVDYTNLLRRRGTPLLDAVREAGHSRLRPVLMTALTTIFAMVPMATSSGMGSEMWVPLGITVIGGLFISTLITLVLIPVMYISMHRKQLEIIED